MSNPLRNIFATLHASYNTPSVKKVTFWTKILSHNKVTFWPKKLSHITVIILYTNSYSMWYCLGAIAKLSRHGVCQKKEC